MAIDGGKRFRKKSKMTKFSVNRMYLPKVLHGLLLLLAMVLVSGCAGQQTRMRSSIVDYLYPEKSETAIEPSIPVLNIPIKVGIAFVPEDSARSGRSVPYPVFSLSNFSEQRKSELLERAADHFRKQEFVSSIEVIPSAYLIPGGGFSNLDQIRSMFGVDVIALVSYDQVQFTDEDMLSLSYWTLIGAYVVSGEKNDTSTLLDTALYDIKSKKMLFRAPGTSVVKGKATAINLSQKLREDSQRSFEVATVQMIANLDVELSKFKEKIKNEPEQVKIIKREGYGSQTGTGSIQFLEIMFMLSISLIIRMSRETSRRA